MQLGMIGLGRMGANMVRRLMRERPSMRRLRHARRRRCAAGRDGRDRRGVAGGIRRADSPAPRAIWLMVPAAVVDNELAELVPLLSPATS